MSEHRPEVADVFRTYGDDFLALWEWVLSRPQRKAFDDIRNCRTAALGGHVQYYDCGHCAISYNSCRNRSCRVRPAPNGWPIGKLSCCRRSRPDIAIADNSTPSYRPGE